MKFPSSLSSPSAWCCWWCEQGDVTFPESPGSRSCCSCKRHVLSCSFCSLKFLSAFFDQLKPPSQSLSCCSGEGIDTMCTGMLLTIEDYWLLNLLPYMLTLYLAVNLTIRPSTQKTVPYMAHFHSSSCPTSPTSKPIYISVWWVWWLVKRRQACRSRLIPTEQSLSCGIETTLLLPAAGWLVCHPHPHHHHHTFVP